MDPKGADVVVFTIGLGADVDHGLLSQCATHPGLYYAAPTADDLEAIYLQLLRHIPCDPSVYWAGR
jgi:hypothetical protein